MVTLRRSEVRSRWDERVGAMLAELEAAVPPGPALPGAEPGEADPLGHSVRVGEAAEACGRRAARLAASGYRHSPATTARRIGLAALVLPGGTPSERVAEVIAHPRALDDQLADWLRELGPAGTVPVESAARAWVVDSLARANPSSDTEWKPRSGYWKHQSTGLAISASADALRREQETGEWRLYLTRGRPGPHDERVARLVSLAHALGGGFEASSVRLGFRRTGTSATVEIGPGALATAVSELREIVAWRFTGAEPDAVTGPSCAYCELNGSCAPGAAAVESRRRLLGCSGAGPQSGGAVPVSATDSGIASGGTPDPTM